MKNSAKNFVWPMQGRRRKFLKTPTWRLIISMFSALSRQKRVKKSNTDWRIDPKTLRTLASANELRVGESDANV